MLTKIGRFLLSLTLLLFAVAVHAQTPTASISCPATALVGEPVICDGSASTNVNGQLAWSTKTFVDGTASVAWDFDNNLGPYSKAELLKATHVYLTAGTYTIHLTVKNSSGTSASASASITISDIPAATGTAIHPLTDHGSVSANCTALQGAIDAAFMANTIEQEIHLPAITYTCALTVPAAAGNKYVTPAADGTDIGVNFNDVTTATANSISGDWSGGSLIGSGDFVTDTFTEASDTTLASHTGEVGATWTLHPSYSGAALDNDSLKRVYLSLLCQRRAFWR